MPFDEGFLKSRRLPEVSMEDENPPPKKAEWKPKDWEDTRTPAERAQDLKNLQELVKALEAGGYDKIDKRVQGSPLVVESLAPVMKVVTYGDPRTYEQWSKRCLRIAKVFRFLRFHSWACMCEQAAHHFEEEQKRHTIHFQKTRSQLEAAHNYHETKHR